jgi:PPOX class probable FMN-dependent enzyme
VVEDVLASYPSPSGRSVTKEISQLDEYCRAFIEMCPLVILSTASADGEPDLTPRGGEPGFLRVLGPHELLLPDRPGNNRLDNLRKAAVNPRVALLCLVPGIDETLRVYGRAEVLPVEAVAADTSESGRPARSLLLIHVDKAFMHCAKALMRGRVWDPAARVPRDSFPSMGEIMRAHAGGGGPVESQEEMIRRYQPQL